MKSNEERLQDLLAYVDSLTRVHPSEIPGIDLYMDPVSYTHLPIFQLAAG